MALWESYEVFNIYFEVVLDIYIATWFTFVITWWEKGFLITSRRICNVEGCVVWNEMEHN